MADTLSVRRLAVQQDRLLAMSRDGYGTTDVVADADEVVLDRLQVYKRDRLLMVLRPASEGSRCPAPQRISRRTHSLCKRRLGDLPWDGIPVAIELQVRRFFCDDD